MIKNFLAKIALKIFKSEYKILQYDIKIGTKEKKMIEYLLEEVALKDDAWHDVTIHFWAKNDQIESYVGECGIWNRALTYQEKKSLNNENNKTS